MKFLSRKPFLFLPSLFLATCVLFPVARMAQAAPPQHSDYAKLIKDMMANPATGIASTKAFLAAHPDAAISDQALLERTMSQVYNKELKDPKSALAVLDAGDADAAKAKPGADQDTALVILLSARTAIYASQHQYQQTVDLVDKNISLIYKGNSRFLLKTIKDYGIALEQLHQGSKLVSVIEKAMLLHPEYAEDPWIAQHLVNNMEGSAALGYAKLFWMVCPFDTGSIRTATNLLTSAWMKADLNAGKGNAFIATQKDSTLPNPLTSVKLPALDADTLASALTNLTDHQMHDRITILLLQGKMRDAMLAARRNLLEHPSADNSAIILEMARVFKAADLNVVRANAFLQYFQTGKGANPLDDFFKQYPAGTAAK